ncbi:MAG: sulfatase-like hydrolase/transferase [Bacteroidota bacterium]
MRILNIKYIIAVILAAFFLSACVTDSTGKEKKPNIIFIMADDMGKEWVSAYGSEDVVTSNIDRLAQSGMRLDNVYAMPQCTPTRVTLLTGQYPFRHGWINHWDVPRWGGGAHFDKELNPSLGRVMKEAGYKTLTVGKWQINDYRVQPGAMTEHGFDDYCMWTGFETGNPPSAERYYDPYIHTKEGSRTYRGAYGPDLFTDYVINFLRENREEPMFIYYPMVLVHNPPNIPPGKAPDEKNKNAVYASMVEYADSMTGRIMDELEELGLRENTLLIFTADNGSPPKVNARLNGIRIKGGKGKTTENGVNMPFILSYPSALDGGTQSDALIDFSDLLPTFAELAGARLPRGNTYDGRSFAPLILGREDDSPRDWILAMGGQNKAKRTEAGVENMYNFRDRVIRNKRFKLYINTSRQPEKLIDLQHDPLEQTNLIDSVHIKEVRESLKFLKSVLSSLPEKDNDPRYKPLPPQPWDVEITEKSQEWKK